MSEPVLTGRQLMGLDPPIFNSVQERHPGDETSLITEESTVTVESVSRETSLAQQSEETGSTEENSREITFGAALMPVYSWGADCTGSRAGLLSLKTPVIWPYVTGEGVAWSEEEIRLFRGAGAKIYLVNQGDASKPFLGDEFDVESGAITPQQVISIIQARRERKWSTRVYGTYDTYREVTAELVTLGLRRSVWWRIADWNLSAHLAELELWGDVYAGQWASPTSNPNTLLPLTGLTLAQAGADLNVVLKESTGWQGLWYGCGERESLRSGGRSLGFPARPQTSGRFNRNAHRPYPHRRGYKEANPARRDRPGCYRSRGRSIRVLSGQQRAARSQVC